MSREEKRTQSRVLEARHASSETVRVNVHDDRLRGSKALTLTAVRGT